MAKQFTQAVGQISQMGSHFFQETMQWQSSPPQNKIEALLPETLFDLCPQEHLLRSEFVANNSYLKITYLNPRKGFLF